MDGIDIILMDGGEPLVVVHPSPWIMASQTIGNKWEEKQTPISTLIYVNSFNYATSCQNTPPPAMVNSTIVNFEHESVPTCVLDL